ncbi:ABC transporter permease [Lachnospiraceae bacterium]|nr:ABC transporter permease [Lachnospiraceae bacterium]
MFFRLYVYSMKQTVRQKLIMFWSLIFPIILGTLFRVAFGEFLEEEVIFHQIPVAYVAEEGASPAFAETLKSLEDDGGLLEIIETDGKKAESLLKEEKVEGIFYNRDSGTEEGEVTLTVTRQEMSQSILSSILEQYQRVFHTMGNISRENPAGIEAAAKVIGQQRQYLMEGSITDTPKSVMTDYFYALLAMDCLMGVSMGLQIAVKFKANLSNLAVRRVVSGTSRFGMLMPDLAARITIQFLCTLCSVCYLTYVMKISLGNKFALLLLTTLVGSIVGIFMGFFIGAIGTYKESLKEGVCVCCMMFSSFLSGLMVGGMYRFLETHAPLVNRINPASLIVKSLYSLNIYEGYERYTQSMASLLTIAVLLGAGAFAMIRRERYASI